MYPLDPEAPVQACNAIRDAGAAWLESLGPKKLESCVLTMGSYAIGCPLDHSDVDLVLLIDSGAPINAKLESLAKFLGKQPQFTDLLLVCNNLRASKHDSLCGADRVFNGTHDLVQAAWADKD